MLDHLCTPIYVDCHSATPTLHRLVKPPSAFAFSRPTDEGRQFDGDLGVLETKSGANSSASGCRPYRRHLCGHDDQVRSIKGEHEPLLHSEVISTREDEFWSFVETKPVHNMGEATDGRMDLI